jgi:type II secretory pathway pseudopilin PulG
MELVIVLIILGVAFALGLPNYTTSTEQARASNAKNNLLSIYSAQQNYNNNNNAYCLGPCDNLTDINTQLNLQIQDDGTYTYACAAGACTATRAGSGSPVFTLVLAAAIVLNNSNTNANTICPYGTTTSAATSNPQCQ